MPEPGKYGRRKPDLTGVVQGLGLRPAQVDEVRLALHRKGLALRGEVLGEVA